MADEDQEYVFYRHRSEWSDVKGLSQDEGPAPVVQIAYSDKFKDAYDYFRAVLQSGEKSERTLELTKTCISLNPANYTVWQYRRQILQALKKDIGEEMQFLSDIIVEQQKNYQVWHHRRALVEWSGDASAELKFTAAIIAMDQKNYHAWQHRQWVLRQFGEWAGELEYVDSLLRVDVRNNSAWNERFFVVTHTTGLRDDEVVEREVTYTLKKIDCALRNESAWNYLRGILQDRGLTWSAEVKEKVEKWRAEKIKAPQLTAFIIDMHDDDLAHKRVDDVEQTLQVVEQLCAELADETDTIRRKYWKFVLDRMRLEHKAS